MKLPAAIGSFEELFNLMNSEIKERRLRESNVGDAVDMSEKEKKVSFLNNYFVFKKVRDVDAGAVYKTNIGVDPSVIVEGSKMAVTVAEVIEEQPKPKRKIKKRKKKIKIVKPSE